MIDFWQFGKIKAWPKNKKVQRQTMINVYKQISKDKHRLDKRQVVNSGALNEHAVPAPYVSSHVWACVIWCAYNHYTFTF